MIERVIIPNRGEIAVRIARACREMKITSILAYSDLDDITYTPRFFDEAISLGESYLDVARVTDAARRARAAALHPGSGFVCAPAGLASACWAAGLAFV